MPPRPPLTHFLSLPLASPLSKPALQASLQHFTASVTFPTIPTIPATSSIPLTAIRPAGTLHLTLGVMSLPSRDRVEAAVAFLRGLDLREVLRKTSATTRSTHDRVVGGGGEGGRVDADADADADKRIAIELRGLKAMGNPAATSVLYAVPEDASGRLGPFCSALREVFTEAGFVVREERGLVLHATVVNMTYAKEEGRGGRVGRGDGRAGKGKERKGKIDATYLLEEWEEWVWAEGVRVERVGICEMGARVVEGREGEGDVYVEAGGVDIP
ncbi:hypothetical protein MMC30_001132 [Trapelia coarctata]|nr:hypothetical protein [Trapelia coarctata]